MCTLLVLSFWETLGKESLCVSGGMHLFGEDWTGTFYFMSTNTHRRSFFLHCNYLVKNEKVVKWLFASF